MRWEGDRQSDNVEDMRGGGGGGFGFCGRSLGIGAVVVALLGSWLFGVSPTAILNLLSGGGSVAVRQQPRATPANDQQTQFVRTVLAYTEDTWADIFRQHGATYRNPTLTIFEGATGTACGTGQSAMGPFYCPAEVIAHEVGHHVQNLLGISDQVRAARGQQSGREANAASVRLELQADCFAGVWAKRTDQARQILEQGDVASALRAASAIGDDALQRQSRGVVVPDSFTHGTSAQRVRWFTRGVQTGDMEQCDTFEARQL